ncbi:MAG: flagellar protein FliS [Planctomycetes bacterium]|nr:flagellar protein FliS [Planctomycetota bacterium]
MVNSNNEYLESQVLTAPPYELHRMVVDAAIRHARRAEEALARRDYETSYFSLNSARDCVNELIVGLDRDRAPDLVDRLRALFVFVHRRLVEGDLYHDPRRIRDAIQILEMHRDTWCQLIERLREEQTSYQDDVNESSQDYHGHDGYDRYDGEGVSWLT